jgi:hypothetical protein
MPSLATIGSSIQVILRLLPQESSRNGSVDIATGDGLQDGAVGVRFPVWYEFSLLHVLGPPNLLYNGYRRLFPRG